MNRTKQRALVKDSTRKKQSGNRKTSSNEETEECNGVDYPVDIWFIISEYIKPEAIRKFACICRSSYYVTTTAKFWFHVYKTYYKYVPGMPQRLQPHCMMQKHGLRACVIRALHYNTYFEKNIRPDILLQWLRYEHPHSLVKRQCSLMWHTKERRGMYCWYFCLALKETSRMCNGTLAQRNRSMHEEADDIEMIEDINANPEEGRRVLQVRCLKYSNLPLVIGLTLQRVLRTLMLDYNHYRLQLEFGTSDLPNAVTKCVIINDVINYKILDWWQPDYPYQDTVYNITLTSDDSWD